jgi:protein-S-isoprenylcysteine O-methyltransferase Ste14
MHASSRWSEFRAAGGLWVLAQFAVMAGITAALFLPPEWPEDVRVPLAIVGLLLVLAGVGLVVWAYRSLGRAFSPFPHPPPEAERVEAGPYRLARHPMYGGGILFFAGLSLVFSIMALVLTAALALLWRGKSAAEERVLVRRFPDYDAYRRRTRRRFLPGIY